MGNEPRLIFKDVFRLFELRTQDKMYLGQDEASRHDRRWAVSLATMRFEWPAKAVEHTDRLQKGAASTFGFDDGVAGVW